MASSVIFFLFFCLIQRSTGEFHLKFIGPALIIRHIPLPASHDGDIIIATHSGFVARLNGQNGDIKWRRKLISDNGVITKLQFINDIGGNGAIACSVRYMLENSNDGTSNRIPMMNVNLLSLNDGSLITIESNGWDIIEGLGAPSPVLFSDSGFTTEIVDSTQKVKNFCLIPHNKSIWLATLKTGLIVFTNSQGKDKFEWIADPNIYGEDSILTMLCNENITKHSFKFNVYVLVQRMSVTNYSTHFPIESIVTLDCYPDDSFVYERISHISENINIPKDYIFLSQKSKGQCLAQLFTISASYYLDVYKLDANFQYYRINLGTEPISFVLDNLGNCIYSLKSQSMEIHLISITNDGAKHVKLPENSTPCYCLNNLIYLTSEIINGENHISFFRVTNNVKMIYKLITSNLNRVNVCSINSTKWSNLEEGIDHLTLSFEDDTIQHYNQMKFKFQRFESLSNVIKTTDLMGARFTKKKKNWYNWFIFEIQLCKFFYRVLKFIPQILSKIIPFVRFKLARPIPFKRDLNDTNSHQIFTDQFSSCEDFLRLYLANNPCTVKLGRFDISCSFFHEKSHEKKHENTLADDSILCGPHHHILYHMYKVKTKTTATDTSGQISPQNIDREDVLVCLTSNGMIFGISKTDGTILYHTDSKYGSNVLSLGNGNIVASNGSILSLIDGISGKLIKKIQLGHTIAHLSRISPSIDSIELIFTTDGLQFATLTDFNLESKMVSDLTLISRDGDLIKGYSLSPNQNYYSLIPKWSINYTAASKRIAAIAVFDNESGCFCEFNNDNTFSFPYLNPHLLYVISVDSKIPESDSHPETILDVLDTFQGKVITSIILTPGATAPFKLLSTDHLLALHYWNAEFNRYELMILELYNSNGNIQILSLVFGAPFGISAMAVTNNHNAILGKKYIFALIGGLLATFDETLINARRPMPKNLFTYFFASIEDKILPNQVFPKIHDKIAKGFLKDYETLISLNNGKILNTFIPECKKIHLLESSKHQIDSEFVACGIDIAHFTINTYNK